MSEENKAVVRRVFDEVINKGNFDVAAELTTPTTIIHVPFDHPGNGTPGLVKIAKGLRQGFPDIHIEIDEIFDVDDRVVVRWRTTRQTHLGAYRAIPPTGKKIELTAIHLFRLQDARIVEFWLEMDQLGAVRQMGVVPPEDISSPRRAAFVLGSLFKFAFLEAKYGIRGKKQASA